MTFGGRRGEAVQTSFKLAAVVINFAHFDASHASPFDVTASDFKLGIPKGTSRESAAEVAYARSYEEPTPGSGDRPLGHAVVLLASGGPARSGLTRHKFAKAGSTGDGDGATPDTLEEWVDFFRDPDEFYNATVSALFLR